MLISPGGVICSNARLQRDARILDAGGWLWLFMIVYEEVSWYLHGDILMSEESNFRYLSHHMTLSGDTPLYIPLLYGKCHRL